MIKQIYHPYTRWEDWLCGMWDRCSTEKEAELLPEVIEFTGSAIEYGAAMLDVLTHWPIACEHNLTNTSINRRAWIGHAACCLKFGWPECVVRSAWKHLTARQQNEANAMADKAIRCWVESHKLKQQNDKGQIRLKI